jgi:phage replication initiation protein
MGAENISALIPEENRSLIDWFAWTLKVSDPEEAIRLSGLSALDFIAFPTGGMGYKQSMRAENIVVYHDGNADMGCHISMTGKGCRQYEALKGSTNCWYSLFHHLKVIDGTVTRIDLAVDNIDGALDLDRLIDETIIKKNTQSQFRKWKLDESGSLSKEENKTGKTLYVGSPKSRVKIRFYDKAAQLAIDNQHWVRCEIQCMGERAQEAINHLLDGIEIGELTVSILNNYFRLINNESENKSQCSTQDWWESWLCTTQKIRLTTAKVIKYVNHSIEHLKRQYSATFAMCKKFLGVASFKEFITELVDTGTPRLTKKHYDIIKRSNMAVDLPF